MKTVNDLVQDVITYATSLPENQKKPLFELTNMISYMDHSIRNYFYPEEKFEVIVKDDEIYLLKKEIVKLFYNISLKGYEVPECYNCDNVVLNCKCGDTSTLSNNGVACPHCGFLDLNNKSEERKFENTCKSCDRTYLAEYNNPPGQKFWVAYKMEGS